MHRPGIEPGAGRVVVTPGGDWQRPILPLNHQCLITGLLLDHFINLCKLATNSFGLPSRTVARAAPMRANMQNFYSDTIWVTKDEVQGMKEDLLESSELAQLSVYEDRSHHRITLIESSSNCKPLAHADSHVVKAKLVLEYIEKWQPGRLVRQKHETKLSRKENTACKDGNDRARTCELTDRT